LKTVSRNIGFERLRKATESSGQDGKCGWAQVYSFTTVPSWSVALHYDGSTHTNVKKNRLIKSEQLKWHLWWVSS